MTIEISLTKEVDANEWNSVLEKSGYCIFKSFEWSTLGNYFYLCAKENGKLVGGCLLMDKKILGFRTLISLFPFGLNDEIVISLIKKIKRFPSPIKFISHFFNEIQKEELFLENNFVPSPDASYVIDLKRSEKELWF